MKNYFKKFSIMFVMLLAIVGVGVIQDGSIANASTVGVTQLISAESGWTRYEDTDKNISYVGNWSLYRGTASIWTNGTAYYSEDINSVCKFNFTGDKIRIITELYSNHTTNVNVKIDGISYNPFSERNSVQKGKTLVFEKTGLSEGEHSIVLTNMVAYQFVIDAIDIDGKLLPYNEIIIDQSISLNKSSINLAEGTSEQLTATTTPSSVTVNWKSSDESIATVDSNGNVTAIKEGQATITATMTDGSNASDSCIVNVIPKDTEPTEPDPTEQEYIVNTAYAKGDNTNNGSGSVTIIFHGSADTTLSVVKTADVEEVWVGDNFTYTIVVTNTGSKTAKDVVIRDSAPNHIEFNVDGITTTQGEVDSSTTSSNLIVNVGDIPAGGTVTIKIPVTVV